MSYLGGPLLVDLIWYLGTPNQSPRVGCTPSPSRYFSAQREAKLYAAPALGRPTTKYQYQDEQARNCFLPRQDGADVQASEEVPPRHTQKRKGRLSVAVPFEPLACRKKISFDWHAHTKEDMPDNIMPSSSCHHRAMTNMRRKISNTRYVKLNSTCKRGGHVLRSTWVQKRFHA
jgi:hypothetical protein